MLTAAGPKLLDFGLAKWNAAFPGRGSTPAESPGQVAARASQTPTASNLTTPGAILGTLQYMAPEQLEGLEADARTDIFAFGAVLHEMITGKKTFEGKSRILLMSAIATAEPPPLSSAQPAAPGALNHVVKTCLAKDPQDRWQTARDLLAELKWIAEARAEGGPVVGLMASPAQRKRAKLYRILLAAAALLILIMALPAVLYIRGPKAAEEFRFQIPLSVTAQPYDATGTTAINQRIIAGTNFAISPDGCSIAFVSRTSAGTVLCAFVLSLRDTAEADAHRECAILRYATLLVGDSRFRFVTGGKLKKSRLRRASARYLRCSGFLRGTWNREGVILFGSATGLFRVSAKAENRSRYSPGTG
jgi:hypothetical protein